LPIALEIKVERFIGYVCVCER